ncbi:DUF899 domain-containing protein [Angustibacter sp. McL0619]|uniref:DUF899 domain-containing protein n=1 Tax=Angustibacter sp. McL0619 TaxID=3415676 RepID=UPI003CEEFF70
MTLPDIVSPEQWRKARVELLVREKEYRRSLDALNADRRRLPMVRVEKDYRFDGPDGETDLAGLFDGRRQLIMQHVMFDPAWDDACPSCTAAIDELSDGLLDHVRSRDTTFVLVARAPLAKIVDYRDRKGWTVPWFSSYGSDFNYDFHVTLDASKAPLEYNYRSDAEWREHGWPDGLGKAGESSEQPGYSCFLRDGDEVFHTYSTFGRGTEQLGGGYAFLDMTALGRQEDWEEPKGRADATRGAVPNFED